MERNRLKIVPAKTEKWKGNFAPKRHHKKKKKKEKIQQGSCLVHIKDEQPANPGVPPLQSRLGAETKMKPCAASNSSTGRRVLENSLLSAKLSVPEQPQFSDLFFF